MREYIIGGIIGFVIGGIIIGLIISSMAPSMMLLDNECKYNFTEASVQLEQSILKQGWIITKVYDLESSMKKYGKNIRPVRVYEICHPDNAERILNESNEGIVHALMPYRVVIYEKEDGGVYICRINPKVVAKSIKGKFKSVIKTASEESEIILSPLIIK